MKTIPSPEWVLLHCYDLAMQSTYLEAISVAANVATAEGIQFTAGQFRVAAKQHTSFTETHVRQLHSHFQAQMRECIDPVDFCSGVIFERKHL